MDKTIARLNIEHFRKRLAEVVDERERRKLTELLAAEEAKLVTIQQREAAEAGGKLKDAT